MTSSGGVLDWIKDWQAATFIDPTDTRCIVESCRQHIQELEAKLERIQAQRDKPYLGNGRAPTTRPAIGERIVAQKTGSLSKE